MYTVTVRECDLATAAMLPSLLALSSDLERILHVGAPGKRQMPEMADQPATRSIVQRLVPDDEKNAYVSDLHGLTEPTRTRRGRQNAIYCIRLDMRSSLQACVS